MKQPVKVNDVDIAFGGRAMELLPKVEDIPKEFFSSSNKWHKLVQNWFFNGDKYLFNVKVDAPKEIDVIDAVRHLQAILVSFSPKHEHKIAGCAYLMSQFFKDFIIEEKKEEKKV